LHLQLGTSMPLLPVHLHLETLMHLLPVHRPAGEAHHLEETRMHLNHLVTPLPIPVLKEGTIPTMASRQAEIKGGK